MGRREENKALKLAAISQTALKLFVEHGYHRTSVEQIAAGAGVARGTFYLYFEDKSTLFQHLLRKLLDPLTDAVQRCCRLLENVTDHAAIRQTFVTLSAETVALVLQHQEATLLYYREQRDPSEIGVWLREQIQKLECITVDIVRSLMTQGFMRPAEPVVVALAITGAIDKLAWSFLSGQELGDAMAVGLKVVEIFGIGLMTSDAS